MSSELVKHNPFDIDAAARILDARVAIDQDGIWVLILSRAPYHRLDKLTFTTTRLEFDPLSLRANYIGGPPEGITIPNVSRLQVENGQLLVESAGTDPARLFISPNGQCSYHKPGTAESSAPESSSTQNSAHKPGLK